MNQITCQNLIENRSGIGLRNEGSLHSALKSWYAKPGDRVEVKVKNYIIDIVRGDLLIEIQTGNFAAIRNKLKSLLQNHSVHLVYPIPQQKWIVKVDKAGTSVISRRRSPKKGKLIDLFDELLRIPTMINHPKFSLEVLMIAMEEVRCADGKGSWRRKGVSIKDRRLVDVEERIMFCEKKDFLKLLPDNLIQPFSNKSLAKSVGITVRQARKMTYSLKKMELIAEVGKEGNALLYKVNSTNNS